MADLDAASLSRLFAVVGARLPEPANLYVLGGGALVLLGNPRRTRDLNAFNHATVSQTSLHQA
jgi:hypothetical protein